MESSHTNPYAPPRTVAEAEAGDRAAFIQRTYLHLAVAILAFAGLEAWMLTQSWALNLAQSMLGVSWLLVIGLFMVVSWVADRWAQSSKSRGMQYAGLGLFIVAEAIIFLPLLMIAATHAPSVIGKAAWTTGFLFLGLTLTAFAMRTDFSFLKSILIFGGFVALGLIVLSFVFPALNLGTWFSVAMIGIAAASILYTTSNIMHQYRTDQHVAAALALFAGVALMFWYVLRLFMARE